MTRWIEFLFRIQLPVILMTLVALATLHLAFARPMSQSVVATPPKVQALLDRLESEQAFSSYRSRSTLEKVLEAFPREQGLSTEESVHFYCGLYQTPGAFGRSSQLPSGTGDWLLDHLTYRSGRGASVQLAYLRSEALPSCISTLNYHIQPWTKVYIQRKSGATPLFYLNSIRC